MNNPNQTPGTPPADPAGQTPGQPSTGGGAPAVDSNNQPTGGIDQNQPEEQVTISAKELNEHKRKSGRWDALQGKNRKSRRDNRRQNRETPDLEQYPEDVRSVISDRDGTIQTQGSEILGLKTKNQVRDLFDADEYKDIPAGIRRAVIKNPMGFSNQNSQSVEDVVDDIRDYLDDELDSLASSPNQQSNQGGNQPAGNPPANPSNPPANPQMPDPSQIPPATGSGPATPGNTPPLNTEGKRGMDKVVATLQHSLKYKKHG